MTGLDLKHTARMLLKRPEFTGAAIMALALGIGANSAIFSIVNAALFRSLPYREPSRLFAIQRFRAYGYAASLP